VLADYKTADISPKLRAMLGFIDKLSRTPAEVGPADARAVLDAGVSEKAFIQALHVQAMFHFLTRAADAFNFEIPPESGFVASARSLLKFGYKL
jgi:alkylhydroperoxidase family enzyme